mmetsp:Transcript_8111/g.15053  ORF Transcript_8111/g.15053 Transcript_8111/m.15053 type:complete len:137 (-) Transcript_8111:367-777(-)|eukprot:CAMPEP_0197524286 /NCGR_PEP_ID=MMETSP1318-20131121/8999_1 /TAXON_ID=552666 /ORGANISM="Partenskyella glossopodia, Strain RCC365" /LENGTH=136 /DNA_ID=CAMNT_0043077207 /DNA_START=57 /DNA_END=467 /DNA_ORIENTATION=+
MRPSSVTLFFLLLAVAFGLRRSGVSKSNATGPFEPPPSSTQSSEQINQVAEDAISSVKEDPIISKMGAGATGNVQEEMRNLQGSLKAMKSVAERDDKVVRQMGAGAGGGGGKGNPNDDPCVNDYFNGNGCKESLGG